MKIAIAVILASMCCCALASCPTKSSVEDTLNECMEKASPGSSGDKALRDQIEENIIILSEGKAGDYAFRQMNDTIKKITVRVVMCFAQELLLANPDLATIAFDCMATAPGESRAPLTQKEVTACVSEKLSEMCPSELSGKSKRSVMSFFFK